MTPPTLDPTNPEALMRELFDDDRWVKDQFAAHLGQPLVELCDALAGCFRLMNGINEAANRVATKRNALVGGFVFGVLDDLVTSTKLLVAGKLPAAGNLMRQVVEGIAMAILCSTDELLIIETKRQNQPPVTARYWEKVWDDDTRTEGHRAVGQLAWNAAKLGVLGEAVEALRRAKKHYNGFSHCGKFTIASRLSLEEVGKAHLGGHFDEAKLGVYRSELESGSGCAACCPR
ncbi:MULTISPECIES: hypothetical protein [Burkholderia cepacia complex]|uniref:hypothetical protein n=1 Tax=Burkholderia cepacia complex TaxID=87882 RepID=UPI001FC82F9B|nr:MULTISPECIES: hypothetical protein [Burkholderia cepacia complex]